MNKKRIKIILVITLMLIEVISISLTIKSFSNKPLNETKEENKIDKKQFSMYIENDTGEYTEYTTSELFPVGYTINLDKSSCVDTNGNLINGILTGEDNKVTVTSNKTSYCYLYFDKIYTLSELCSNGDNLGSCLTDNNSEIESLNDSVEGGLYRYQGTQDTVNDNYICFGTTDKSECTSNTDTYMYRIMGVTSSGQVKLIKKEALNDAMKWYSNYSSNITWPSSTIYSNINGSSFLTNTTYVPSRWSDKIATTTWKYGDNTTINHTASALYDIENAWTTTINAKVGLMYAHDYFYAYQSGGLNCSSSGSYSTCKTAWMNLSICDSGAPITTEWTMSRHGQYSSGYHAWLVVLSGRVYIDGLDNAYSVRPVFYLNADEIYTSGKGTIDDPIIIGGPPIGEYLLAENTNIESLNDNVEGGLYRYQGTTADNYICFGTSDKDTCTGNTDAYMYRIIGINESGQLKLIKKEALESGHVWHSSYTTNATWPNSDLYGKLNGSTFLTNTTYVPSGWSDKIATTTWKYGDNTTINPTAANLYSIENAWTTTTSAKIGLMYAHDYFYAYQSGGLNCSQYGDYSTCKTAWMYLSNCDSGAPSAPEWTMSRYGQYSDGYYVVWSVHSEGHVALTYLTDTLSVRPVFFLESSVEFVGGTGTSSDPFLIS